MRALDENPGVPMSTVRCPLAGGGELADPNVVKVVVDAGGFALYFSRAAIPYQGEAIPGRWPGRTVTSACTPTAASSCCKSRPWRRLRSEQAERLEQLRALEHGHRIRTVEVAGEPVGVDTPGDLDRVRRLVAGGAA